MADGYAPWSDRRDTWTEWAAMDPDAQGFWFTSHDRSQAEKVVADLRKQGRDVVLGRADYEEISRLRRTPWAAVATTPSDAGAA